ncbi:hypothetical protein [Streptococcus cuniculi]|nr:hypothetical protein [Streptococcus cuniculi]
MTSSNLQTWLQGDGFWFITAGAILLILMAWKNSSWGDSFLH